MLGRIIVGAIGVLLLIGMLTRESTPAPVAATMTPTSTATREIGITPRAACNQSPAVVRQQLKAPTTATFPSCYEDGGYTTVADNISGTSRTVTVQGYVDSQNSFGAMIRSQWQTTTTCTGGQCRIVADWVR